MTALAASSVTLRVSGWIWFVLGALAAAALTRATPISTAQPRAPVLIKTACPASIALVKPDGKHDTVTLRGPGVYQLAVTSTDGVTIGRDGDQRPTDEFPVAEGGVLTMPDEWCVSEGGFISPGLGSGLGGS